MKKPTFCGCPAPKLRWPYSRGSLVAGVIAVTCALWTCADVHANALYFGRDTDTVEIGGQTSLGAAATIEAIILFPRGCGAEGSVFTEWTDNQEDKQLFVGPNRLRGYGVLGSSGAIDTSPTISYNSWHHVAYVYDGVEQRLYLDGQLVASQATSGSFANGAGGGFLGAVPRLDPTWKNAFIGYVDCFRLSTVARYAGASFAPPTADFPADADTEILFHFNEPTGTILIEDLSGNGHTGSLGTGFVGATSPVFAPTAPLTDGTGVVWFTSLDDTIEVAGQTVLGSAATFEAVIQFPSTCFAEGSVFNEWTDNLEDKQLFIGPGRLRGYGVLFSSGAIDTNVALTFDTWHHIAYVYDGVEQRLYLDGSLVLSQTTTGSFGNSTGSGFLGGVPRLDPTWSAGFVGYMDSFRISGISRYDGTSFTPPTGDMASDPDTLLLYNFEESPGSTTVTDLSGNGRTGTLGTGFAGAKEPVFIERIPALFIARAVALKWPVYGTNYVLETTASLTPPIVWAPITNALSMMGDYNVVFLEQLPGGHYYRLRRQ